MSTEKRNVNNKKTRRFCSPVGVVNVISSRARGGSVGRKQKISRNTPSTTRTQPTTLEKLPAPQMSGPITQTSPDRITLSFSSQTVYSGKGNTGAENHNPAPINAWPSGTNTTSAAGHNTDGKNVVPKTLSSYKRAQERSKTQLEGQNVVRLF